MNRSSLNLPVRLRLLRGNQCRAQPNTCEQTTQTHLQITQQLNQQARLARVRLKAPVASLLSHKENRL